jgi:Coenzyme PQQ synthesis protein D (PqqD)
MRARRRPVLDEYVDDGRAAVFSDQGMVVVLSELATVAWSVLDDGWTPVETVAEALVAEFGAPDRADGALELTEQALRTLAEHALVELEVN